MQIETLVLIHDATHVLSMPLAVLIAWWYAPRYGYERKKACPYALLITVLVVLLTYVCRWIPAWFGYVVYLNSFRSFLFIPLFTLMLRRVWKIPMLHGADFMTPIMFFERTMVLVGCTLLGCGRAIPSEWGIYSPNQGCTVFPMDLIDLLGNFVAAVISLIYAKKLNYNGGGRIFALSMYILAFVRLFIQFGSMEVWWIRGFNDESVYSIVAIAMAIVIYRNWQKNIHNNGNKPKWRKAT